MHLQKVEIVLSSSYSVGMLFNESLVKFRVNVDSVF